MQKPIHKPQRGEAIADADIRGSIPNIPFVNLHAVLSAKRPKFVLVTNLAMMLLLRRDIRADLLDVGLTYRKRTISTLPEEVAASSSLFLHPFDGPFFASSTKPALVTVRDRLQRMWT